MTNSSNVNLSNYEKRKKELFEKYGIKDSSATTKTETQTSASSKEAATSSNKETATNSSNVNLSNYEKRKKELFEKYGIKDSPQTGSPTNNSAPSETYHRLSSDWWTEYNESASGVQSAYDKLAPARRQLEEAEKRLQAAEEAFLADQSNERAYNDYLSAIDEYNGYVEQYKPLWDAYDTAHKNYSSYNTEYEKWRSSIRGEADIQKSLDELNAQIDEKQKLLKTYNNTYYDEVHSQLAKKGLAPEGFVSYDELMAQIAELEEQRKLLNEEMDFSKKFSYGDLSTNADYAKMSRPAEIELDKNIFGKADPSDAQMTYYYINNVDGYRDNLQAVKDTIGYDVAEPFSAYNYMTEEQKQTFTYIYNTQGEAAASEYLNWLKEGFATEDAWVVQSLNAMKGADIAKTLDNDFLRAAYGVRAGLDQFESGMKQLFTEEELPTSAVQYAGQAAKSELGKVGQFIYDAGMVTGNMLPSIMLSTVTGGLGAPTLVAGAIGSIALGASAGGNAYNQALKEGYSTDKAKAYGTLVGVSEGALQYALGGIGKLGGVAGAKVMVKIAAIDNALARMALTGVVKIGSEVLEENLQEFIEPAIRSIIFDEIYDAPNMEELIYTTLLTAVTTGLMSGGEVVSAAQNNSVIKVREGAEGYDFSNADAETINELIEAGLEKAENTEAHQLALDLRKKQEAGKKISSHKLGTLAKMTAEVDMAEAAKAQKAEAKAERAEAKAQRAEEKAADKYALTPGEELAHKITGYGKHGSQIFVQLVQNEHMSIEEAVKTMQTAYESGFTDSDGDLSNVFADTARRLAYNAGKQDAMLDAIQRKEKKTVIRSDAGFDMTNAPADVTSEDRAFMQLMSRAYAVRGVWGQSTADEAFDGKIDNDGIVTLSRDLGISTAKLKAIGGAENLALVANVAKMRNKSFTGVLGHEIAIHRMMELAPEEGLAFIREWYKYQTKDVSPNAVTLAEKKRAEYGDISISLAIEELAADGIVKLYGSEKEFRKAMERIITGKNEKAKSGLAKYIEILKDTVAKLKAMLKRLTGKANLEAREDTRQAIRENERLIQLFEDAQKAALKNVKEAQKTAQSAKNAPQAKAEAASVKDGVLTRSVDPDGTQVLTTANGNPVAQMDNNGNALFSLKTYEAFGRAELKRWLDLRVSKNQLDKADAADLIKQLDEYAEMCQKFKDKYAPFGAWSEASVVTDNKGKPVFSVVKANGEYAMNLDFSLVCKKRRTLDAVFREMIRRGLMSNVELEEADIAKINEVIRESGFETACALCFVDSKRYRQAKVADTFVTQYNDMVSLLLPEGGDVKAHYFDFVESGHYKNRGTGLHTLSNAELSAGIEKLKQVMRENGSKTVPHKIAKHLLEHPADRRYVNRGEFMNTDGFEAVKLKNPAVLKLYNSSKGSGGPKAAFSDVQYLGEILQKNNFTPARAYAVGGVRIQSFSDYIPRLVFDYLQMTADLAAKKLPAHAYTKEAIFVKQFGMTGIKMNMSLVPAIAADGVAAGLDKDGNYYWFDGQSFGSDVRVKGSGQTGFELAVQIQNAPGYSQHCGTIAVGVSKEHIEKMLDDENIRMIIPYHKSSLNHIVAVMNNIDKYTDYTNVQNTRFKDTGKKIDKKDFNFNEALRRTGDAKMAANEYLAWCEDNGYLPKFDEFAGHENYYKVLEDFATYDNGEAAPQGAVTMTFPKEGDAFGSMAELIEEGLDEDAELEGRRDKSLSAIVDKVESVLTKKATKYSKKDSDGKWINEARIKTALADVLDHGDMGDDNMVLLGDMPQYIQNISNIGGDLYIFRNHAYENMVSEERAKEEGRIAKTEKLRRNQHFHALGEETMIKAILALNEPLITIADRGQSGNPALSMVLPVFDAQDNPIHAVVAFYANEPINGEYKKRPHVAVTFYGHPYNYEDGSGRRALLDVVNEAIAEKKVLDFDNKKMRADLPVIAQDTTLRNITASTLAKNVSQFQKDVKSFKEKNRIKYSRKSDTDLLAENEKLKEVNAELKAQFKRTKFATVDKKSLEAFTKQILKDYQSGADINDTRDSLNELYTYIANGEEGHAASWDTAYRMAYDVAQDILSNASILNDEMYQMYSDLRHTIRTTGISLSKVDEHDIMGYESLNEFRKANFGRIKIVNDGLPVDVFYQELSRSYPELFDEYEYSHPGDQLSHIEEVLDSLKPVEVNPYKRSMRESSTWLANDIMERFFELPQAKPTFADKAERKLTEQKIKDGHKIEKLREEKNERIKSIIMAERKRAAERVAKEKADKAEKLKALKQKQRAKESKMSESRKAKVLRERIMRHVGQLHHKLTQPTDKQHIPQELRTAVTEMLSAINLESKFEYAYGKDGKYHRVERGEVLGAEPTKRTQAFINVREQYAKILTDESSDMVVDPALLGNDSLGVRSLLNEVIAMSDTPIDAMSTAQLQTIWDTVRTIEHSIAIAGKVLAEGKYARRAELAEAFREGTSTRKAIRNDEKADRRHKDIETPYTFFSRYGEAGHDFYRMLRNAQDREQEMIDEIALRMQDIVSSEKRKKLEKEAKTFDLQSGEKLTLSKAHCMNIYLLYNREAAKQHLLVGGVVQPEVESKNVKRGTEPVSLNELDIGNIISYIEEERGIADKLQKLTLLLAEWGNEASMAAYGYEKFGDPHYWTIRSANEQINQTIEKNRDNARSIANMGSAKPLTPNANNALDIDSAFATFDRHEKDMVTYAAWLCIMEDANALFNFKFKDELGNYTGKNMKTLLNKYGGASSTSYWLELMKDIQNGIKAPSDTGYEAVFAKAVGKVKKAAVSGNIRVVAQQPTAYARAAAVIGIDSMLGALGKDVAVKPALNGWQKAVKYAPIAARKAAGGYEIASNLAQLEEFTYKPETGGGKFVKGLQEAPLWAAGMADKMTWGTIWNACEIEIHKKNKKLDKNSDEFTNAVKELFTEVIDQTQVVDGVLQRSQAMRSGSALMQQATSFTGEPTMAANMIIRAYDKVRHESDPKKRSAAIKGFGIVLGVYGFTATINAFAQSLIDGLRDDDDEEEYWEKVWKHFSGISGKEEKWHDYARNIVLAGNLANNLNPMSWLPYWKDILSLLQGYSVERMDAATLGDFIDSVGNVTKSFSGEGKLTPQYALMKSLTIVAKLNGSSAYNIVRDIEGILHTFQVETDNLEALYETERLMTRSVNNKKVYMNLLYRAYESDSELYKRIYNDLIADGFTEEELKDGLESEKMKAGLKELGYKDKKAAYDAMYQMLLGGDKDAYYNAVETLVKHGAKRSSIESAMRSRAEDAGFSVSDLQRMGAQGAIFAPTYEVESATTEKFNIDNLSDVQYEAYSANYGKMVDSLMNEIGNFAYLEPELANSLLDAIYDYSEKVNLAQVTGGKFVKVEVDGSEKTFLQIGNKRYPVSKWIYDVKTAGLPVADYLLFDKGTDGMETTMEKLAYMDNMRLTESEENAILSHSVFTAERYSQALAKDQYDDFADGYTSVMDTAMDALLGNSNYRDYDEKAQEKMMGYADTFATEYTFGEINGGFKTYEWVGDAMTAYAAGVDLGTIFELKYVHSQCTGVKKADGSTVRNSVKDEFFRKMDAYGLTNAQKQAIWKVMS